MDDAIEKIDGSILLRWYHLKLLLREQKIKKQL